MWEQLDDKAYQINVLHLHNLEDRPKLDEAETDMEEVIHKVTRSH